MISVIAAASLLLASSVCAQSQPTAPCGGCVQPVQYVLNVPSLVPVQGVAVPNRCCGNYQNPPTVNTLTWVHAGNGQQNMAVFSNFTSNTAQGPQPGYNYQMDRNNGYLQPSSVPPNNNVPPYAYGNQQMVPGGPSSAAPGQYPGPGPVNNQQQFPGSTPTNNQQQFPGSTPMPNQQPYPSSTPMPNQGGPQNFGSSTVPPMTGGQQYTPSPAQQQGSTVQPGQYPPSTTPIPVLYPSPQAGSTPGQQPGYNGPSTGYVPGQPSTPGPPNQQGGIYVPPSGQTGYNNPSVGFTPAPGQQNQQYPPDQFYQGSQQSYQGGPVPLPNNQAPPNNENFNPSMPYQDQNVYAGQGGQGAQGAQGGVGPGGIVVQPGTTTPFPYSTTPFQYSTSNYPNQQGQIPGQTTGYPVNQNGSPYPQAGTPAGSSTPFPYSTTYGPNGQPTTMPPQQGSSNQPYPSTMPPAGQNGQGSTYYPPNGQNTQGPTPYPQQQTSYGPSGQPYPSTVQPNGQQGSTMYPQQGQNPTSGQPYATTIGPNGQTVSGQYPQGQPGTMGPSTTYSPYYQPTTYNPTVGSTEASQYVQPYPSSTPYPASEQNIQQSVGTSNVPPQEVGATTPSQVQTTTTSHNQSVFVPPLIISSSSPSTTQIPSSTTLPSTSQRPSTSSPSTQTTSSTFSPSMSAGTTSSTVQGSTQPSLLGQDDSGQFVTLPPQPQISQGPGNTQNPGSVMYPTGSPQTPTTTLSPQYTQPLPNAGSSTQGPNYQQSPSSGMGPGSGPQYDFEHNMNTVYGHYDNATATSNPNQPQRDVSNTQKSNSSLNTTDRLISAMLALLVAVFVL